jgi:AraC-like DNA-binding protein
MNISQFIDFFESKLYNIYGDNMEKFMNHNFTIGEITFANIVKSGTGAICHKNRKSHGIALFLGGERVFSFEDKKFKVLENTLFYFPKGSNYTIQVKTPSDCYAINFEMPDGASFEPFALKTKNLDAYLNSFQKAQKYMAINGAWAISKIKSELYNIIYNMQSEYNAPYSKSNVIEPAINYISLNYYKESINVEFLASLCKISSVHLRNVFSKKFGTSPIKYINTLKINHAKELLSSGLYSVKEVAEQSGFFEISYFTRFFKKNVGVSPIQYINQILFNS